MWEGGESGTGPRYYNLAGQVKQIGAQYVDLHLDWLAGSMEHRVYIHLDVDVQCIGEDI